MSEPPRLPREVEADPRLDAVRRALAARTITLRPGGALVVAVVPLTDALRAALTSPATGPQLSRGLETAAATLAAEARGLGALPEDERERHGARVSRLLLVTNDGVERFHRQVERLAARHAPRVLVCMVDCDSASFGRLLYGGDAVVKAVLTGRKHATAGVLLALAAA